MSGDDKPKPTQKDAAQATIEWLLDENGLCDPKKLNVAQQIEMRQEAARELKDRYPKGGPEVDKNRKILEVLIEVQGLQERYGIKELNNGTDSPQEAQVKEYLSGRKGDFDKNQQVFFAEIRNKIGAIRVEVATTATQNAPNMQQGTQEPHR